MGGYYFRPGTGSGRRKWQVYLPGGGWCVTVAECVERAGTGFGSTRGYPSTPAAERGLAAVLEDLQHHRGFGAASQILLSGSSAGGQATANLLAIPVAISVAISVAIPVAISVAISVAIPVAISVAISVAIPVAIPVAISVAIPVHLSCGGTEIDLAASSVQPHLLPSRQAIRAMEVLLPTAHPSQHLHSNLPLPNPI
ncbi:unnamed protein product [Closterium sp. NIES-65]|nr:unnamed protein product [Closterium sp. NIES-65]